MAVCKWALGLHPVRQSGYPRDPHLVGPPLPPGVPKMIMIASGRSQTVRSSMRHSLIPQFAVASMLAAGFMIVVPFPSRARADDGVEFFERRVRPILVQHCYECHSMDSDELGGGLALDSQPAMIRGGDSGPSIDSEDWRDSSLLSAIEYREYEMPPDEKLLPEDIQAIRQWLRMGAPDPRKEEAGTEMEVESEPIETDLWSLHPIQDLRVPEVANPEWRSHPVDAFVFERLQEKSLTPNGLSEPRALIRRLYFDLTGLPPAPEVVESFVAEPTEENYRQQVDTLLQSTAFGERWARHWLDVVRYGESAGSSRDVLMPYAWRYRDYVIDALNSDVGYDRFLTEQLAGDLLESSDQEEADRLRIATGLLAIGSKSLNGGNLQLDIIDDQIDVVSRAVLGMTVSCARCHDHKFDPIPTADYYALAGVFRSTRTSYGGGINRPQTIEQRRQQYLMLGPDADSHADAAVDYEKRVAQLRKQRGNVNRQIQQLRRQLPDDWQDQLAEAEGSDDKEMVALQRKADSLREKQRRMREIDTKIEAEGPAPNFEFEYAIGVTNVGKPSDAPIQIRGEQNRRGDTVPRGFLGCVTVADTPEIASDSSGRLELAEWLTQLDHPLTSRVVVNRVWQHLFGQGLVSSVDNFGATGQPPSHPELLDYLAHRFIHHHKWSMKSLIAELVSTRTYRLSSANSAENYAVDPANVWRWRMERRRLEAEPLRDAILAVSGALNHDRPEGSRVLEIGEGEVGRGINIKVLDEPFPHRSVYLPIIRGIIPPFLKVFDFPEPSNIQGERDVTHIPSQALFLMNSEFVYRHAVSFAKRMIASDAESDQDRIKAAYLLAFGRHPNESEVNAAIGFLDHKRDLYLADEKKPAEAEQDAWTDLCQALFASAEFRFVD